MLNAPERQEQNKTKKHRTKVKPSLLGEYRKIMKIYFRGRRITVLNKKDLPVKMAFMLRF